MDPSGLASISEVTSDYIPDGFSTQLMVEYPLCSKSWLYEYGKTVLRSNADRVCSVGTVSIEPFYPIALHIFQHYQVKL